MVRQGVFAGSSPGEEQPPPSKKPSDVKEAAPSKKPSDVKEAAPSKKPTVSRVSGPLHTGPASVGVDIGHDTVKIIRLDTSKAPFKVVGVAVERIFEKNYREALSKALVRAQIPRTESVAVSVNGQGVVSRRVELPMMNKSELESSMQFEIEKYVPFPTAEVFMDYVVIQELKNKSKMAILIAAAKKELVQGRRVLADEVNMHLKLLDLDCLALANAFTEVFGLKDEKDCLGIVNLGKTVSSINILSEGVLYLSRDIFMGGNLMTKKISEVLEIGFGEAEKLKLNPGSKKEKVKEIQEVVLHDLAGEIRVSLDYFEARSNKVVERVYVTGGCTRIEGLEEFLKNALSLEIKKLCFAEKLTFSAPALGEEFKKDDDILAIALGLALR